jgi:enoyl-CoA hydratase/carnithine racemase
MYDALYRTCLRIRSDPTVRCFVLRGLAGGAFAAGTDINHFRAVGSGEAGVEYEDAFRRVLDGILDLPVPTLAVIEGHAIGGGLLLAAACDLRLCTHQATFGVPIARTVGNCISQFSFELLASRLGAARTMQLLLTADLLDAASMVTAGFAIAVVDPAQLEERVRALTNRFHELAPLTIRAAKVADQRHRAHAPESEDFIRMCYASVDFAEGVAAFLEGRRPVWHGE